MMESLKRLGYLLAVIGYFVGIALAVGAFFGLTVWAGFTTIRVLGVHLP